MLRHLVEVVLVGVAALAPAWAWADDPDFTGNWDSTYGAMRLDQEGSGVTGTYSYSTGSSIRGTVDGNRLTFRYTEPSAAGDGWFEISDDGEHLDGQWREDGTAFWTAWNATRVGADPERRWLYVIEAYWEESIAEPEYAFGDMLRVWFERYPDVEVRHRRVHDGDDLRAALTEATFLAGPTAVWIASHGTQGRLAIGADLVPVSEVAEALRPASEVFAVHFSSCEMGVGDALQTVRDALTVEDAAVTGFAVTVDWSASALIEIAYLDLLLGRGLRPSAAFTQVMADFPMAGDRGIPGSPFSAASMRIAR